jgi:hypothetical protein
VVKLSDIDRDERLTDFLNGVPLNQDAKARKDSAERLIDQQIIRDEVNTGGYTQARPADADGLLHQILRERFGGDASRLNSELARYGLTEGQLRQQLLWQLTVLRFIQQRFQSGLGESGDSANKDFEDWLTRARQRTTVAYRQEAFQ